MSTGLALAVLTLADHQAVAGAPSRPNVLLLVADDMRADAIAALGNPVVKTPNLDDLARSGLVFEQAYCLGSNRPAVCLPSRNMLMSGFSYFRWNGPYAPGSPPNFPLSMEAAGYETYHHGKRGNVALEIEKKFNHSRYLDDEKERTSGFPGKTIVDQAIAFFQAHTDRRDSRPFFLYLAFECPHDPRVARREFLDLYDSDRIPLPTNYRPIHPFDNGEMTVRDERLAHWPRTPDEIRRQLRDYYAVITSFDREVGRLLRGMKDHGELDNTIVVFTSDNGLALGSHGLMGKQNLYEHSMRIPLIFSGPGIPRGRSEALVYLLDVYPTVCELTGAAVPNGLDGLSLAPILNGKRRGVRDSLFLSYRDRQRAIRDERWKLIRYPLIDLTQLFDLERDPGEQHNLASEPAQQARIARMMGDLRGWQARLGDRTPLSVPSPGVRRFVPPTQGR